MSNILNNFYINVASSITKTMPINPKSPLDYLSNRTSNSLFLTPVTPFEVKDINSIPIKLLKIVGCSISPLLALLINQSFQSGIYPDKFKIAKVISLFIQKEIQSFPQIIGQFLFYPFLVRYLKSSCTNEFIVFLKYIIFFILYNLGFKKTTQLTMP